MTSGRDFRTRLARQEARRAEAEQLGAEIMAMVEEFERDLTSDDAALSEHARQALRDLDRMLGPNDEP
ncbi:hypothetical protein ABZ801_16000 [Actinomadura sp. NPDC047616]|uniref:hypothetical protein n=1 Tax=Actinomadura sp. NPDC047616 TaxID=3155914 RepID=UPI0033D8BEFC